MPILSLLTTTRSRLLSSTAFIRYYAAGGYNPELVADFVRGTYSAFGKNTATELLDHTRNGNATMTDSSGNIVWAPHNLLTYSEDLASGGGAYGTGVISGNEFTFTVSGDYFRMGSTMSVPSKGKYTGKVTISGGEMGDTFALELVDDADGSDSNTTIVTLDGTTTEWTVEADFSGSSTFSGSLGFYINRSSASRSVTAGSTITVNYMHVYRSDLGGMADNPDQPASLASYVPTTSSAVYLPRRGHHAYNGSQWVNKGLFVESEARTNLVTYSVHGATYSDSAVTVTSGTAPDGSSDGAILTEDTSTYYHRTRTPVLSVPLSSPAVASVYIKNISGSRNVYLNASSIMGVGININPSTGAINATSGSPTVTVENVGNETFRVSWTGVGTGNSNGVYVQINQNTSSTDEVYLGDGSSAIQVWGFQVEQGSTPSSYIPTSGATVTRPAESITIPAANLPWPTPQYVTGEELVTNGTFDTDTSGWTARNSTITQTTYLGQNCMSVADDGTYSQGYQAITTVAGGVYEMTMDIALQAGATQTVALDIYDGSGVPPLSAGNVFSQDWLASDLSSSEFTEVTVRFVASSTSTTIAPRSNSTETAYFDNISVKEINPLALSIQMKGEMTYADEGSVLSSDGQSGTAIPWRWFYDTTNYIDAVVDTESTSTGKIWFMQEVGGVFDYSNTSDDYLSPGINVPFNISSRHGSTFVNGAVDGVALTEDTTPVALPDLENTDLDLAYDFNGTISLFRIWSNDIGDDGIAEAST